MTKLEKALDAYSEKFGENYPLSFGSNTDDLEIIKDIERCIETGEKAQEPEYEEGCDY